MSTLQPLEIPRDILKEIYRQALREYPHECCGWLLGDKDSTAVNTVRTCVNVIPCANMRVQSSHPSAPNRGAETAYAFGPDDLMELSNSFNTDTPARIIYHSHPNGCAAYLSATDRREAAPWGDGPAYPVQQLVIGTHSLRVVDAALYAWSDTVGDFIEIARFDGADI